jgi:hypothetical protein
MMKEEVRTERSGIHVGAPHRAKDLDRPQRMLGIVLWLALFLVLMWMRVGFR